MTKKFVYQVRGWEMSDTEAFGETWKAAKEEAARVHAPIFRLVIKGEDEPRQEVFYKAGCFNSTRFMTPDSIMIF